MKTYTQFLTEDSQMVWTNPRYQNAATLSGVTPQSPLKTFTAYHVTRRENIENILRTGFDLRRVKPIWMNDYAISLSRGLKGAAAYFSQRGQSLNIEKYGILEFRVKARLLPGDHQEIGWVRDAPTYTKEVIALGYDGIDLNLTVYIHNPLAIMTIREVKAP